MNWTKRQLRVRRPAAAYSEQSTTTTRLAVIVTAVTRIRDDERRLGQLVEGIGSEFGDCGDDDDEIAVGVIVVRSGRLLWCPCDRRRRRRRLVPSRSPDGVAVSLVIAAVRRRRRGPSSSSASPSRLCRWAGRPQCPYSPVTYVVCSVLLVSPHRKGKKNRRSNSGGWVHFTAVARLEVFTSFGQADRYSGAILFFGGLPDKHRRCHVKNC